MLRNDQIIRIFIASPGDLGQEREIVRKTIDSLNRTFCRKAGVHVDLIGWEDTMPGVGRPQSIINAEIEACDIFVGVLWKKWGTDTGGGYDSGFYEEFELASRLYNRDRKPEILIFFKDIDPDQMLDAGPQLRKVLDFKDRLEREKQIFFKPFKEPAEFATETSNYITSLIYSLKSPIHDAGISASATEPPLASATLTRDSQSADLVQLLPRIAALASADEDVSKTLNDDLSDDDIARLYSLSKALLSFRRTGDILSSNDINSLYLNLPHVSLTKYETLLILRTVLSDIYEVAPGWRSLSKGRWEMFEKIVFGDLPNDPSNDVKRLRIQFLNTTGLTPSTELGRNAIARLLTDSCDDVREDVYNYLRNHPIPELLPQLRLSCLPGDEIKSTGLTEARIVTELSVNSLIGLKTALTSNGAVTPFVLTALTQHLHEASVDVLMSASSTKEDEIRKIIIAELFSRGAVNENMAEVLTKDSFSPIRVQAIRHLATLGHLSVSEISAALEDVRPMGHYVSRDEVDSIIVKLYETYNDAHLQSLISWDSTDSQLAYFVYHDRHFPLSSDLLRRDLSEGFLSIRDEFYTEIKSKHGLLADSIIEKWIPLDDFMRYGFTKKAIAVLAKHNSCKDRGLIRDIARRWPTNSSFPINDEVVSFLILCGSSKDLPALRELSLKPYNDIAPMAAKKALSCTRNPYSTAIELLQSPNKEISKLAISHLMYCEQARAIAIVRPYLYDERSSVRLQALSFLYQVSGDAEISNLLINYPQDTPTNSYYYNVIAWADRVLYAPQPLRDLFKKQLIAQLDDC